MAKKIIWSRLAHNDKLKILEYWFKRNNSFTYSKRLNQIFENTAELISKYPKIGKRTEIGNVRYKVVKDYFLTYRETEQYIEILTIWDSRLDPDKFERILKCGNLNTKLE
jgi:plasmid stabilization system protein ParE